MTIDMLQQLVDVGSITLDQEKSSVKERYVMLTASKLAKDSLQVYITWIRPVLLIGGMSSSNPIVKAAEEVCDKWTTRAWELLMMAGPEWQLFLAQRGVNHDPKKKIQRFRMILKLTREQLVFKDSHVKEQRKLSKKRAVAKPTDIQAHVALMTRHNRSAIINGSGAQEQNLGASLKKEIKRHTGNSITTTLLRKLITTDAKGLDEEQKKIVDQAMEHTKGVAVRNYTLANIGVMTKDSKAWAEHFEVGLNVKHLAKYL
jgi:hypothetical protein